MTYFKTWREAILFSIASLDAQGKRSGMDDPEHLGTTMCAYRGRGGERCAIGMLIPDDLYSPDMEGQNVYSLLEMDLFMDIVWEPVNSLIFDVLKDLQVIHDIEWLDHEEKFSERVKQHMEEGNGKLYIVLGDTGAWELELPKDITPPWSTR